MPFLLNYIKGSIKNMNSFETYLGYSVDQFYQNKEHSQDQLKEPIISDELAVWIELKERDNPYPNNLTNDELRWRLGRRSVVKEILDLYQKQNSDTRSQAVQDICNKIHGN